MNNNYKESEREISISQLLWRFVRSWRGVCVSALVFAVLLGATQFVKDTKNIQNSNNTESVDLDDVYEKLTDAEKREIEEAKRIQKQIAEKEEYQSNSILMNIDSYNKNVVVLQYYVDTNYVVNLSQSISNDYTQDVVDAYIMYIGNRGIASVIEGANKYTYEVISAGSNANSGVFAVFVAGKDEESANFLADKVDNAVMGYQAVVSEKIKEHDLILISKENSVLVDQNLASQQEALSNTISNLYIQQETLLSAFSSEQLMVYTGEIESENIEETVIVTKVAINMKYVVFGIVIGVIVSFMWVALKYIFDGHIKNQDELHEMYQVRVFGNVVNKNKQKKKAFSGIDMWIERLQNKEYLSIEEYWKLTITNVVVYCKKEKIEKVFLTTSLKLGENERRIMEELVSQLAEKGIGASFGEKTNRNAETIEHMVEVGNVIIVEKIGASRYEDIDKELALCSEQTVNVLGTVVLQ